MSRGLRSRWSKGLVDAALLYYVVHGYPHMAFVINALAIADEQYLGGFMMDLKGGGYLIRYGTIINEVQVIKVDLGGLSGSFQPVFDQMTGRAPGTVLKDQLRAMGGFGPDLVELSLML